jgi:hypothetical protein
MGRRLGGGWKNGRVKKKFITKTISSLYPRRTINYGGVHYIIYAFIAVDWSVGV